MVDTDAKVGARGEEAYRRAKQLLVIAATGIAAGLAVAGSLDQTAGGAVVLAGWVAGVVALHRLGRAGSVRPAR